MNADGFFAVSESIDVLVNNWETNKPNASDLRPDEALKTLVCFQTEHATCLCCCSFFGFLKK